MVRQLRGRGADFSAIELEEDDDDIGLSKATGAGVKEDFSSRLKRVTQLTGLSDPVYAEAYVTVHSYDILLEVLLINQTNEVTHSCSFSQNMRLQPLIRSRVLLIKQTAAVRYNFGL